MMSCLLTQEIQEKRDSMMSLCVLHDDELLAKLRQLVQDYVNLKYHNQLTAEDGEQLRKQFSILQAELHDALLRDYSHFEFFEQLISTERLNKES